MKNLSKAVDAAMVSLCWLVLAVCPVLWLAGLVLTVCK